MAQDFSAKWNFGDLPYWRAEDPEGLGHKLRDVSTKVWPRVLAVARRELANKFSAEEGKIITIESWEDALLSVSATLKRHEDSNTVQDLEGFLVGTFEHRLARAVLKEKSINQVIEYHASEEALEGLKSARMENWVPDLENDILINELLRRMDDWTKKVFLETRFGFKWSEIAKHMGMGQDQLKSRFRRRIQQLRRDIGGEDGGAGAFGDANE
jgi:DNA-directed RNA polymerase specialized sigma24 family protein